MLSHLHQGRPIGATFVALTLAALTACSSGSDNNSQTDTTNSDSGVDTGVSDVNDSAENDTLDLVDSVSEVEIDSRASDNGDQDTVDSSEPDLVPQECLDGPLTRTIGSMADTTFVHGPYLMWLTPSSVTVMWKTAEPTGGKVLFGETGLELTVEQTGESIVHEITLTDLKPDTIYQYKTVSGSQETSQLQFRTAVRQNQPFRYVLWGDNQNGPEIFAGLLEQIIDSGPHIALGVGDHVQDGDIEELWEQQLFGPARALFHQVPFYAARGNHEGYSDFWFDYVSYPHDKSDPDTEGFYYYTYGNAFFLVVDTNTLLCPFGDVDVPQSALIKEALASPEAAAATWKFAYAHESAYSESWGGGSCHYDGFPCVRNWLVPLLAENGFHAWFAGHTHDYERGMVNGMAHIIAGGGGGGLDEWCLDWPTTTVVYQNHHFIRADVGCEQLRIEGVNQANEVFDWLVMAPDRSIIDQGPMEGLPEIIINSDSPTRQPQ